MNACSSSQPRVHGTDMQGLERGGYARSELQLRTSLRKVLRQLLFASCSIRAPDWRMNLDRRIFSVTYQYPRFEHLNHGSYEFVMNVLCKTTNFERSFTPLYLTQLMVNFWLSDTYSMQLSFDPDVPARYAMSLQSCPGNHSQAVKHLGAQARVENVRALHLSSAALRPSCALYLNRNAKNYVFDQTCNNVSRNYRYSVFVEACDAPSVRM